MLQQRQAFQCELDAIDAKVIELFGLVVPDLARATHVLLSGDNGGVEVLAQHKLVIDLLCPEIEELAKRLSCCRRPLLQTCASCSTW